MPEPTGRIDLGFAAERSVSAWERRHAAGGVPGRWPYGLDGLADRIPVRPVDLRQPSRFDRARRVLGAGPKPATDATGVTWDENAALRMATVAPHARRISGVIWLTDSAVRGRDLGRMPEVLRGCDALWVLSEAQLEPLRAIVPGPRVHYVRFGIDPSFFTPADYPERPRVVSVGGDRDRDAATLFAALDAVRRRRPDAELVVQTSSDLTPPDGVTTIRHLPHTELRELYRSASVVAIATAPNLHVSGMTVSLEAMATARPVAITRTPGMEDYVADGDTGMLSPQGDADALAAGILDLLDDPAAAAAMGREARTRVEERFSSEQMCATIAGIVEHG